MDRLTHSAVLSAGIKWLENANLLGPSLVCTVQSVQLRRVQRACTGEFSVRFQEMNCSGAGTSLAVL